MLTTGKTLVALRVREGSLLVRLIPAGRFEAPRGALSGSGPWNMTAAAAASIIARNASRQTDILIDYEHQILAGRENGQPAPAAGWINPRTLVWIETGQEPGLHGAVIWTSRAGAMIAADEYRYLSPVFTYDPATGVPTDLLSVALTNTPGIDDVPAALSVSTGGCATVPTAGMHGIDAFNRCFGPLGVLHPDTDRHVATLGMGRVRYLASIGVRVP